MGIFKKLALDESIGSAGRGRPCKLKRRSVKRGNV